MGNPVLFHSISSVYEYGSVSDNMGVVLAIQGAISQGILWSLMAMGVYMTYKILNFADLTVEGSFALGGSVSAMLIVGGMNPFLSLIFATLAGVVAGIITGILHTKLKIPGILAGILSMISLYSINLRIMGQSSNTPLLGQQTVFTMVVDWLSISKRTSALLLGILFAALSIAALYWFFGTEIGSAIRATGNNEEMVRALGADTDWMKMIGLFISNGFVALSGGLVAQNQGFADVGMGIGAIVIGLASVIIGEVLLGSDRSFGFKLMTVVVGSVIYRVIIAVVLQLGLKTNDLKLLTAIIVAAALSIPVIKKSQVRRGGHVNIDRSPQDIQ